MTTTTSNPDDTTTSAMSRTRERPTTKFLVAGGLAVAANLVLYAVVRLAGGSLSVAGRDSDPSTVAAAHVAVATVLALIAGSAVASIVARTRPAWLGAIQVVGAVVAVVSIAMPLALGATAGTKLVLAIMHLTTGAAFVAAVGSVRTR